MVVFSRKIGHHKRVVRASKTKRERKKRAKERNRLQDEAFERELQDNLATAHLRPTRMRRLVGIGSRGVGLTLRFDYDTEIPYDPDDPVGSVEHAREVGNGWADKGYPTAGEA